MSLKKNNIKKIIQEEITNQIQKKYEYVKLSEEDTRLARQKVGASDVTKVSKFRPDDTEEDIFDPEMRARMDFEKELEKLPSRVKDRKSKPRPMPKNPYADALVANTIWNNNLAQLMHYEKGNQLAVVLSKRLEDQTGMNAQQALPIVKAVMQATLEQLDEEATEEIQGKFPGIFKRSRS